MKQYLQTIPLLFSILIFQGCATNIITNLEPITKPSEQRLEEDITIVISAEDLNRTELVSFGLFGFVWPLKIEVGDYLKQSAEEHLSRVFQNTVTVEGSNDRRISLEITTFRMRGMNAKAHLELQATVIKSSGEVLFTKSYKTVGSGHVPIYMHGGNQLNQVASSTAQAFQLAFEDFSKDLRLISFE